MHQGQRLYGGDTDPQTGEGAGTDGNDVAVDLPNREFVPLQQRLYLAGQALAVGLIAIAAGDGNEPAVACEGDAAARSRRIESENDHETRITRCLDCRCARFLYSHTFTGRRTQAYPWRTTAPRSPCDPVTPSATSRSSPTRAPTPAMRQYLEAKRQHPDAIVFFRMGDFYEMFYEDALVAARALDLTLTSRSKDASGSGIPMCGVPHHAAAGYLTRLVEQGFRVAVCEQIDTRKAKGIVRREVVRVVSPGTFTDASYLDDREPSFLMGLVVQAGRERTGGEPDPSRYGMALLDLSTGEFMTTEYMGAVGRQALADDVATLRPREVQLASVEELRSVLADSPATAVTNVEPWLFDVDRAREALTRQFGTEGLDGFGLRDRPAAVAAAGGLVRHLRETQKMQLPHVRNVQFRQTSDAMIIDPPTMKHLEVIVSNDGSRAGSLLAEIDGTVTTMGSRLLRTGCFGRWCVSSGSTTGSTPSRSSRFDRSSAGNCVRCSNRFRI